MTDTSIRGAKGASKPRTPVESPNSLVNVSYANILDGISEGPIVGLVNGAQSIYLDKTPLANSDGSLNFSGVTWEQRPGEHDQDHIAGFPAVESQTSVGVELTYAQPWVQSFSNTELSAVRIQLAVGVLAQTYSNGDTVGYTVAYEIDLSTDDGDYETVLKSAFSGKTTSGYQRSHRIELPPAETGWRLRVRRITPDASTSSIRASTSVGTYTEVIDAKLQYPYTALCGLKIDASQFSSVPERAYRIRGRIVQVPSNYDPASRHYSGSWDGTFKSAWTDCPPWIWRDIVLNDRYGLGRYISAGQVDKWGLYQIARYCDQMVSDGKGGQEPRFTCNLYLQARSDALSVLQDMASVFRGMSYYAGSEVACSADMPGDPVYTYTNANVIDGKFSRAGSSVATRYSVAKVAWSDRENFGNQRVEYVQDPQAIARYGVRETEITAFGCVSQGQAQRAGKYILLTNRLETQTVSFSVGLDGTLVRPGDIIRVADEHYAGRSIGGRLREAGATSVTVDSEVTAAAGDTLVVVLPSGVAQTRVIRAVEGTRISVTEAFDAVPVKDSVYAIETAELVAETYRVLAITENFGDDKLQYDLVAVAHHPGKFAAIDDGAQIIAPPTSVLPASVQAAPTNIHLETFDTVNQGLNVATLRITWEAPRGAQSYQVWWRRDSGDWIHAGVSYTTAIEVQGIYSGTYTARVSATGVAGVTSIWALSEPTRLEGKQGEPPALASFTAAAEIFGIRLAWSFPAGSEDSFYTELQESSLGSGDNPVQLSMVAYPAQTYLKSGMAGGVSRFFRARLADRSGNSGPWTDWTLGRSGADAEPILELIGGQIGQSELGQELRKEIEKISGDGPESVSGRIEASRQALQGVIDGLSDPLEYVATDSYLANDSVRHGQRLYSALVDVPGAADGSHAPPNALYWLDIGGSAASTGALASQVQHNTATLEQLGDVVTAQATSLQALRSAWRDEGAEGDLADALGGWRARSDIVEQRKAFASEQLATAERFSSLDTRVGSTSASLSTLETVVASERQGTAARLDQLKTSIDGNTAAIGLESQVRSTALEALSTRVSTTETLAGQNTTRIQGVEQTQNDAAQSLAALRNTVSAVYAEGRDERGDGDLAGALEAWQSAAKLVVETRALASADAALLRRSEQFEVSLGSTNAAVQTLSQAQISSGQKLSAMWAVKMQVNAQGQYVAAGIGLGIENGPAGLQSQFLVQADRFAVVNGGATPTTPFVVQNGQVFLGQALIGQGWITNAMIEDAAVTAAKIRDATITSGKIADASITSAKIADASISNAKLADATITTAKIADAQINTLKIGVDQVTVPRFYQYFGITGGEDASITFNAPAAMPVQVTLRYSYQAGASGGPVMLLNGAVALSGAQLQRMTTSNGYYNYAITFFITVPAGLNTITASYRKSNGTLNYPLDGIFLGIFGGAR